MTNFALRNHSNNVTIIKKMVKRFFKDTMRFETPKECLGFQLDNASLCLYEFEDNGVCGVGIWSDAAAKTAKPKEMLEIAIEHFNKFGEVQFEAYKNGNSGEIFRIGCYDENATCNKYVEQINEDSIEEP